ncbi:hypothetical protein C8R45DRAFT_972961 [Mycena sanguinolenta]|nr:hypothetical protein C8R45DRAFT_972961 [Mycena sanguinolenta]
MHAHKTYTLVTPRNRLLSEDLLQISVLRSHDMARNSSSDVKNARVVMNAALAVLGNTAISGIAAVAQALGQVVAKVQEMQDNGIGWTDFSNRVQSIAFLVSPDFDMEPELGERLEKVLRDITASIEVSRNQDTLKKFFNTAEESSFIAKYNSTLNDLINDITLDVCEKTNRKSKQIRDELNKFKSDLAAMAMAKEDESKRARISQNFTATIKVGHGVVGLKGKLDVNIQHAEQTYAGPIEVTDGVVGISS